MISIIIPVYNTPVLDLQRCFKSIIAQTYSDWEAVIIDDGSCQEIYEELDRWAMEERRFTVVHQENSGVSDARNSGIQNSSGKFITFCDADDRLKENFLSEAIQYINQYDLDIVIGSCEIIEGQSIKTYQCEANNERPWIFGKNESKGLNSLLDYMITGYSKANYHELGNILASRVYSKMFRKDVIKYISFHPMIHIHEDNLFAICAACKCKRIGVVENIWYEYYMNAYSATHHKGDMRTIENEFIFARELYQYREQYIQNAIDVRMIWNMKSICSILRNNKKLEDTRKRVIKKMLEEECFLTAIKHFDISGYQGVKRSEKWFSFILKTPAVLRQKLLYLWIYII